MRKVDDGEKNGGSGGGTRKKIMSEKVATYANDCPNANKLECRLLVQKKERTLKIVATCVITS